MFSLFPCFLLSDSVTFLSLKQLLFCLFSDGSTPFSYLDNRSKPTNHSSSGFHPAIAFKTKFNQVIKTNKNKSERTRKKQSKSETDMFVELKDTNRNSKGHNSLPMSTSRHYENVNSDHTDYDVDTRPENWVPSYV